MREDYPAVCCDDNMSTLVNVVLITTRLVSELSVHCILGATTVTLRLS